MTRASPVAVTGLGCISAAGPNLPASMESLFRGERRPCPPRRFETGHPVRYPVFEVPDDYLPEDLRRCRGLIRTSVLALAAVREALADAGWEPADLARRRVGVCVGTTVGCANHDVEFYREYRGGGHPDLEPIRRFLRSNPAAAIARENDLSGPCQTVVNACSSGTDAVGIGSSWIRGGLCEVVLAGGADEITRVTYNGFISLMITDERACRPFDAGRRGLNLGEGAAIVVLEADDLRRARARPARSFVLGYGTAADAHHLTAPHPEGRGLRRALADAFAQSGLEPGEVGFVNAHGTGTRENDLVESRVLADVFSGVPFGSTKCYTGHTLGAAGAIEAAFTAACLERGEIPATAGFEHPDPGLPARPSAISRRVDADAALSQSLAFGGNNAVILMGRGES